MAKTIKKKAPLKSEQKETETAKGATKKKAVAKKAAVKKKAAKKVVAKKKVTKKKVVVKKTAARKKTAAAKSKTITAQARHELIAQAAYLRSESQGFLGDSAADWLAAESEVDTRLAKAGIKVRR